MELVTALRTPNGAASPALRQAAQLAGILPPNQGPSLGPFGGLSSGTVQEIARVWMNEFPRHIVPHVFLRAGRSSIRLTIADADRSVSDMLNNRPVAGELDRKVQTVTVSPTCTNWGPLILGNPAGGAFNVAAAWVEVDPFKDFTDCQVRDVLRGLNDVPHYRLPDWITFSINGSGELWKVLKLGGGASLTISRGLFSDPPRMWGRDVLVGLQGQAGLTVSQNPGSGELLASVGWIGLPDGPRPSADEISQFVSGQDRLIGVQASLPLDAFVHVHGAGISWVYSPKALSGHYGVEFDVGLLSSEEFSGTAYGGLNWSVSLADISSSEDSLLRSSYTDITKAAPTYKSKPGVDAVTWLSKS